MTHTAVLPRRPLALLVVLAALLGALALTVARPAPAHAAGVVTGRVLDSTTGAGAAGATVRLRLASNGPGTVLATATTDAQGYFTLGNASAAGNYVELAAGTWQPGWAGRRTGENSYWFQRSWTDGRLYYPGANTGSVTTNPAYITGYVVRSDTSGWPVGGVKVTASSPSRPLVASTTTNSRGFFRVGPIDFEDDGVLKFDGSAVGREVGYFGCGYVVVSFDRKCATSLGVLDQSIRID